MKGKAVADAGLPTTPEGWGGLLASIAVAIAALRKGLQKLGVLEEKQDLKGFAAELVSAMRAENDRHRHGLEEAIDRQTHEITRLTEKLEGVMNAVREANEQTRNRVTDLVMGLRR